jgi:hypothetical protein
MFGCAETALVEEENPRAKFGTNPKIKEKYIPVLADVAVLCGTALCKLDLERIPVVGLCCIDKRLDAIHRNPSQSRK